MKFSILGYFDFLGDRYHITEKDGKHLKGFYIMSTGYLRYININSDKVTNLVLINQPDD